MTLGFSAASAHGASPAGQPQVKKKNAQSTAPARQPAQDEDEDDGSGQAAEFEPTLEDDEPATEIQRPPITADTTPPNPEYRKSSSSSGEKVFDWKGREGQTQVPHPFAEKGLIRITKDKTYIYKVEETEQRRGAQIRIGMFEPTELQNPDREGEVGATFAENYESASNPAVLFDYEWQLWGSPIGKFGLKAGSGIYVAQGHGHFDSAAAENSGREPRENFTFLGFPTSFAGVYHAQFWHKQLFIPYAEGGLTAWGFTEIRDDDKGPKFGGALAGFGAGGLAFNLTYFDTLSMLALDREYGINAVYLTVEYRSMVALSQKFDFSGEFINGGFFMEF